MVNNKLVDIDGLHRYHENLKGVLNTKQDKVDDLETIRSGAALGATALQSVPEEYVTETELTNKGYATTTQVEAKQDKVDDLETIRSGAALGATALQSVPEEYVTETELTGKGYATTTQVEAKQDIITDLQTIREGAALGATALQEIPAEYVTDEELAAKTYATETYVNEKVAALVDGAPETLDTLDELAAALKDNADIVDVLTQSIGLKQDTITDLETIRSGAALGATALQSVPEEYVTETELTGKGYLTADDFSFATDTDIDNLFK